MRRLFLVELEPDSFSKEAESLGLVKTDEFNIIETFIPGEKNTLIQLLSSSRKISPGEAPDHRWLRGEFRFLSKGWKLEKSSPRHDISEEKYYEILLGEKNAAVEQKIRMVFHGSKRKYALEANIERGYAVIQVDYEGDRSSPAEDFFSGFNSLDVIGELFMSLEETFCRLYLKKEQIYSR